MTADFATVAQLVNEHGSDIAHDVLREQIADAAQADPATTASAARAITYAGMDRATFFTQVAEEATRKITRRLSPHYDTTFNYDQIGVIVRGTAGDIAADATGN